MKVRDCLESLGGVNKIMVEPGAESFLNTEVSGMSLVTDNGRLFCVCGGDIILKFHKTDGMRGGIFIARDDHEGEAWERMSREQRGCTAKPLPVLRLVIVG